MISTWITLAIDAVFFFVIAGLCLYGNSTMTRLAQAYLTLLKRNDDRIDGHNNRINRAWEQIDEHNDRLAKIEKHLEDTPRWTA